MSDSVLFTLRASGTLKQQKTGRFERDVTEAGGTAAVEDIKTLALADHTRHETGNSASVKKAIGRVARLSPFSIHLHTGLRDGGAAR